MTRSIPREQCAMPSDEQPWANSVLSAITLAMQASVQRDKAIMHDARRVFAEPPSARRSWPEGIPFSALND